MLDVLQNWFTRVLRRRRRLTHFGRRPLLGTLTRQGVSATLPESIARELMQSAREGAAASVLRLQSPVNGLTVRQAAARRMRAGPNEVAHEQPVRWWLHLWHCYANPFNLLLTALACVSYVTRDVKATVVIAAMVLLSTAIRFLQESRSHRVAAGLQAMVGCKATVLRRIQARGEGIGEIATRVELPQREIVPGDRVVLAAGDLIPADCRLLSARELFVSQGAMTGESLPVEKFADIDPAGTGPLEMRNLLFMGTHVVSGTAIALVLNTGERTYFGTLAARAVVTDTTPNAFQAGVNSVSWLLIRFAGVMVPIVLLVNGFTKGDWLQALLFASSVAVGLTPEMLPMIVTTTLAKGAVLLARRKVVVKRLDAIQNFGAMDVLCTDKTGTLTQDKIALARHIDPFGKPSDQVLELAFLNSHFQTGLRNLLDRAVLDHVELKAELKLEQDYRKVDEIPFDFERRRMSVVVAERDDHHELICKGALEEVLAACTHVRLPDAASRDQLLDAPTLEHVQQVARTLNEDGLRVVAVAVKETAPTQSTYSAADESGLTLVGYIAFLDPPKDSAAPALKALAGHGIRVKVLTGDNDLVAASVCRQVGLAFDGVLLGVQLERMSDEALAEAVERAHVFAKLTPLQKERVVRALRARGHVVGFIGDGINDAPALRAADIGISVDSAVDIAKEAADIILLEKSLLVLDEGVVEGRTTFCNMLKYIRMTASSNFGNVLSVLVASAFLPFLPMLPLQLLVQNLLYDISQTAIPFDHVDAELVREPLKWNPADIGHFMLFFGPISSVFDIITFCVLWWVFEANSLAQQTLFQSGWFVVGLMTQTLIVQMVRTPKLPFIESMAAPPLLAMSAAIMAVGIWLPMGPLAGDFKLQALPLSYFPWLAGILISYAVATTLMKRFYIRRFGWQ